MDIKKIKGRYVLRQGNLYTFSPVYLAALTRLTALVWKVPHE